MIIDAHCHLGASWFGYNRNHIGAEELLRIYDKLGVDKACLDAWQVSYDFEEGNKEVAAIAKKWPDRFIPFAIIGPRDRKNAVEMLKRYVEGHGFRGVKLHPTVNSYRIDSEWLMDPIMEQCKKYNLIVLSHAQADGYCSPLQFGELAKRHPDVNILMGHMGDEGGRGWLDAVEVAMKHPNIYLDTTGVPNEVFIIPVAMDELGAERIVWGSDSPIFNVKVEMDKILYMDLYFDITQEQKDLIMGGNMARLLGL